MSKENKLSPKDAFNKLVQLPAHGIIELLKTLDEQLLQKNAKQVDRLMKIAVKKDPEYVAENQTYEIMQHAPFARSYLCDLISQTPEERSPASQCVILNAKNMDWRTALKYPDNFIKLALNPDPRVAEALMKNDAAFQVFISPDEKNYKKDKAIELITTLLNHPDPKVAVQLRKLNDGNAQRLLTTVEKQQKALIQTAFSAPKVNMPC